MKYYILGNAVGLNMEGREATDFLDVEPVNTGEAAKCPECGDFISGLPWLAPYQAELEVWGKAFGDIAFGPCDEYLVSERFIKLYHEWELAGLDGFHEVDIVKVIRRGGSQLRTPPPKYYCVTIARSRAAIDIEASGLELRDPPTCNECKEGFIIRTKRIMLEPDTWSGEDIFRARGTSGMVLTSKRFKDFFYESQINNGVLIPAEKYSFDFYPGAETIP